MKIKDVFYLPEDTKKIIPEEIDEDFNFLLVYNLPEFKGKREILINEEIEKFNWSTDFLESINNRYKSTIKVLEKRGFKVERFSLKLEWRMVIGLGAPHPQETSMTLHHIYGVPYIPGSALKGVTRHWFVLNCFDSLKLDDLNLINYLEKVFESSNDENLHKVLVKYKDTIKLYKNIYKNIFGDQKNKGKVYFFDAYPSGKVRLKLDIMNPHYSKYYSGNEPPADWQDPVIIKFLTVERTSFDFCIASKSYQFLNEAKKYLTEALNSYGVGAKTSIGYGHFSIGGN